MNIVWLCIRWLLVVTAIVAFLPVMLATIIVLGLVLPRGTWPIFWGRVLSDGVRFILWRK
jgi:hypothetical protein